MTMRSASIAQYDHGQTFTVLDTETTGLSPAKDRLCSVTAIKLALAWTLEGRPHLVRVGELSVAVNPERDIPAEASRVNGYVWRDTHHEQDMHARNLGLLPPFETHALSLATFLSDSVIVAHNAGFDLAFIQAELERCDLSLDMAADVICTKQTFAAMLGMERTFEYVKGTSLDLLCDRLGVDRSIRAAGHTAKVDAELTVSCFSRIIADERLNPLIQEIPMTSIPYMRHDPAPAAPGARREPSL